MYAISTQSCKAGSRMLLYNTYFHRGRIVIEYSTSDNNMYADSWFAGCFRKSSHDWARRGTVWAENSKLLSRRGRPLEVLLNRPKVFVARSGCQMEARSCQLHQEMLPERNLEKRPEKLPWRCSFGRNLMPCSPAPQKCSRVTGTSQINMGCICDAKFHKLCTKKACNKPTNTDLNFMTPYREIGPTGGGDLICCILGTPLLFIDPRCRAPEAIC